MVFAYANGEKSESEFQVAVRQLESLVPDRLVTEQYSSGENNNQGLAQMVSLLRQGDKLIFYSLATTGRTARQLISLISLLSERGVKMEFIHEGWNTANENGKTIVDFARALVEVYTRLKQLAVKSGLSRSTNKAGRPDGTYNKRKAEQAAHLYLQKRPISEIMKSVGIKSKKTLYEYLAIEGIKLRSRKRDK